MRIEKYQSKYFKYLFVFDYTRDKVAFCQQLKLKYSFAAFNFVKEQEKIGWGFNSQTILNEITSQYPEVRIEADLSELKDTIEPIYKNHQENWI